MLCFVVDLSLEDVCSPPSFAMKISAEDEGENILFSHTVSFWATFSPSSCNSISKKGCYAAILSAF